MSRQCIVSTDHSMRAWCSSSDAGKAFPCYISAQPEQSCVKGGMASFTVSLAPAGYEVTEYALQPLSITRQEGGSYSVDFAPSLDRKRQVIISESCTDI